MLKVFQPNLTKRLKKLYLKKLEEAHDAQRSGKIPLYATLFAESEEIARRIDALGRDPLK